MTPQPVTAEQILYHNTPGTHSNTLASTE